MCPWKGQVRYYSVDDGQRRGHHVAWTYPTSATRQIAGRVAFRRGVSVEAEPHRTDDTTPLGT